MKKTYLMLLSSLLILIFFSISFADAAPGRNRNLREMKERLITLRNWQLMEEFNLSPKRAQRVFDILKRFDDKRVRLIQKRRRILNELRDAVESGTASPQRLNRLMENLSKVNIAIAKLPNEERIALSAVFSPEEQARYILFSQRFAKNMRQIIKRPRPIRP